MTKKEPRILPAQIFFALFVLIALTGATVSAATYTVDTVVEYIALDQCTAAPEDCSIRGAIAAASDGDEIVFDLTIFGAVQTIDLSDGELFLDKNLTITGPGAKLLTLQRCCGSIMRIFRVAAGAEVTISGVTIKDGLVRDENGGGIFNSGDLTLIDSTVVENEIEVITIPGLSVYGFGIYNDGNLQVKGSTIVNNTTVFYLGPNPTEMYGGGIASVGNLLVENSTVSKNVPARGGGIWIGGGIATVTNATIAQNFAGSFTGGNSGIFVENGVLNISNSLLFYNSSFTQHPSVYAPGPGAVHSFGHNVIGDHNSNFGNTVFWGLTDIVNHPFSNHPPLQDNGGPTMTYALLPGSPAIDTGNSTLMTDQRGAPRPVDIPGVTNGDGNASDVGAFEVQVTAFNFSGFLPPVNPDGMTDVWAGWIVPIRFSLGGDMGLYVLAPGYPVSQRISCSDGTPQGEAEMTTSFLDRGLRYSSFTDNYRYLWTTRFRWRSTCRRFYMRLSDNNTYFADFRFR